jgi:hypothetical protein
LQAPPLTLLEIAVLSDGYCELRLRAARALLPAPAPGQYLNAALAPGTPRTPYPVIGLRTPDCFQVLSRSVPTIEAGAVLHGAMIEGTALEPGPSRPRLALVSDGGALACAIYAASSLRSHGAWRPAVFAHFDDAVPFKPVPSQILMPAAPPGTIAAVPLLDSWNIPSRLASTRWRSGFYHGDIPGLLEHWWQQLNENERGELQVLGFGGGRFLDALKEWCQARGIPLKTAEIPV